jgi:hypothetical protein
MNTLEPSLGIDGQRSYVPLPIGSICVSSDYIPGSSVLPGCLDGTSMVTECLS